MRIAAKVVLVGLAVLLVAMSGCSGGEQEDVAENQTDGEQTGDTAVEDVEPSSNAAQSRGLPVVESDADADLEPLIVLEDVDYEWRLSPQKGLHVTLSFINPNDTYARARGYVFVVASYGESRGAVSGVYPWDVEIVDEFPTTHDDGAHLLFRRDQEIRGFIPYENSEGFYDVMRIIVYSEGGELLFTNTLDLEVTGEPTGSVRPPRTINL